jgi:hypothetical protein
MIAPLMDSLPAAVYSVVLFGSKSRGDADTGSDTDLAVFADAESPEDLVNIKNNMCRAFSDKMANLSVYSVATAEFMAADGSLFLWHLKLEGRVVFQKDNWFDTLLYHLAPYSSVKAERDLNTFAQVLDDVDSSFGRGESTIMFEAATLFSVLRSLGMIAAALTGNPCFGRLEPIYRTRDLMGARFRLAEEEISLLLTSKLIYSRKKYGEVPQLTSAWCDGVRQKVVEVSNFVRGLTSERIH